jgi:hypothetical protein
MPMAASIAKWGATVSACLGLLRNAPMTPAIRHAVHLPLTVGHPLWIKSADLTVGLSLPVFPDDRTSSVSVGMSQTCHTGSFPPYGHRLARGFLVLYLTKVVKNPF